MLTSQRISPHTEPPPFSGVAPTGAKFTLTPREHQTLGLMAQGLSNKLIGVALDVSEHTAKFHVTNVRKKLDADTRVHAVAMALRMGLIK